MKLVSVEAPEKNVCKMTFSASAAELEEAAEALKVILQTFFSGVSTLTSFMSMLPSVRPHAGAM